MQPEEAIDSWQKWNGNLRSRPVILKTLSGGRSNRSFLLKSGDDRMVLRLNGVGSFLPDAKRCHESSIWQQASRAGIAPRLLYVDEKNSYLVSAHISNHLPSRPPFGENFVERALELLKLCHQLEVQASTINYASHIEQYWQTIEKKDDLHNPVLAQQREPMLGLLSDMEDSGLNKALCHHDPVVANFVGNSDHLYLIDWEYAAHGFVLMDYAAFGVEWEIDDEIIINKTGVEAELLTKAKNLYKYLCQLWEEATG